MNKRGVVFTIDAILALVVVGTIISLLLFSFHEDNLQQGENLHKIAIDSVAILEKDWTLQETTESEDSTELSNYLNSLPTNICGNVSVIGTDEFQITSSQKSGCTSSEEVTIARRVFLTSNKSTYYSKVKLWFKED